MESEFEVLEAIKTEAAREVRRLDPGASHTVRISANKMA